MRYTHIARGGLTTIQQAVCTVLSLYRILVMETIIIGGNENGKYLYSWF